MNYVEAIRTVQAGHNVTHPERMGYLLRIKLDTPYWHCPMQDEYVFIKDVLREDYYIVQSSDALITVFQGRLKHLRDEQKRYLRQRYCLEGLLEQVFVHYYSLFEGDTE